MNNKFKIKRIHKEDVEAFRTVRLKALMDSPNSFGKKYEDEAKETLEYWEDLVSKLSPSSKNTGYILFELEEPIGIIFGFNKGDDQGSIRGVWIDPDYRGKGLASKLIKEVLNWANENSLNEIKLWNVDGNEAAEKLYKKFGFNPTGVKAPLESNPKLTISEFSLQLV